MQQSQKTRVAVLSLAENGTSDPPVFIRCFYCDYEVQDPYLLNQDPYIFEHADNQGAPTLVLTPAAELASVLCPWCWDFILILGGVADSPAHWWSTWRREANLNRTRVHLCFPRRFSEPVPGAIDAVVAFLVGPEPVPWEWPPPASR